MYLADWGKEVGAAVDEACDADVASVDVPLEQADNAPNANIAMRPVSRVRRKFLMRSAWIADSCAT
jgi:hypothetical protein